MDSKNSSIHCPNHPSENIQRVDLDPSAIQQVYCVECILQHVNPAKLSSKLKTIADFIDHAAQFYTLSRQETTLAQDIPSDYEGILAGKDEKLERLGKHIEGEKQKVEVVCNQIAQDVLTLITKKKEEYLARLDKQLFQLRNCYMSFEKKLAKAYPTAENIPQLFPSKEDLANKLGKITNAMQLGGFVKNIKEDLNDPTFGINSAKSQDRQTSIQTTARAMLLTENRKPGLDESHWNFDIISKELCSSVEEILNKRFVLKDEIKDMSQVADVTSSQVINMSDFDIIRAWMPENTKFSPKLIYKGTQDGMNAESFHKHCDNKGSTITLIKCQFQGSKTTSTIGGYIDQSWNSDNGFITSEKAFIFSLTSKVKCKTNAPQYSAYGGHSQGPIFGGGHDLAVSFSNQNFVHPSTYSEAKSIVDKKPFFGGYAYFTLVEIEVYTV